MQPSDKLIRLNKYLALHEGVSRREADDLIAAGKVTVNDEVAVLGARLQPEDVVLLGGKPVDNTTTHQYIMLNKPINYVCSRRQQGDSPTVYDLIPAKYHSLKLVGRLDRDSSGLILLTNDGDFAQQMTHPSFGKTKQYEVSIDRELTPLHQQMISDHGIDLEDGKSQLMLEHPTDDRHDWIITMHEGRNRQIRRTFGALGYTVTRLNRTNFGNYSLDDLAKGEFKEVEAI